MDTYIFKYICRLQNYFTLVDIVCPYSCTEALNADSDIYSGSKVNQVAQALTFPTEGNPTSATRASPDFITSNPSP